MGKLLIHMEIPKSVSYCINLVSEEIIQSNGLDDFGPLEQELFKSRAVMVKIGYHLYKRVTYLAEKEDEQPIIHVHYNLSDITLKPSK